MTTVVCNKLYLEGGVQCEALIIEPVSSYLSADMYTRPGGMWVCVHGWDGNSEGALGCGTREVGGEQSKVLLLMPLYGHRQ